MTNDERLLALQQRGFTPRQAGFLNLVLLHSGYFLRRQYTEYLGVVDGARTTAFVAILLHRQLASRSVYCRQSHVYHVSSPALYAAIGHEHSRHRRPVEPAVLTQKLMTLDVAIAHRRLPCLATEAEKVHFFADVCHVPPSSLPGRIYHSERPGVAATTRYFVDRVPVLLDEFPTFVYVPGWAPLGAFASFLHAYTPLIRQLTHVQILFCTMDQALAARARRLCERRFPSTALAALDPVRRAEIVAHFRARRRFESRDFASFTPAQLEQLKRDLERYRKPMYEHWYQRWCREGDAAPAASPLTDTATDRHDDVRFTVFRLRHEYPLFGRTEVAA